SAVPVTPRTARAARHCKTPPPRRRPLSHVKQRTCRPTLAATAGESYRQGWTPRVNKNLPSRLRAGRIAGISPAEWAVWALCRRCVTFVQQQPGLRVRAWAERGRYGRRRRGLGRARRADWTLV